MLTFRVPTFRPGYSTGPQIYNPGMGGPSGALSDCPPVNRAAIKRTGPNGNMTSMNGSGGGISGFFGFHFAGPVSIVPAAAQPYGNQYAFANQDMFIPGMVKNPADVS
jgi:hypothetical protein